MSCADRCWRSSRAARRIATPPKTSCRTSCCAFTATPTSSNTPRRSRAWIFQIARNAIADHYRRAAVRREQPAGVDLTRLEPPPAIESAPVELRSELAACLRPLVQRLPEPYREALVLTELDGLTQADAATRLGLSTSGMKSRVQRGRGQLRDLLRRLL